MWWKLRMWWGYHRSVFTTGYGLWKKGWGWQPWRPSYQVRHPDTGDWYTVWSAIEMTD